MTYVQAGHLSRAWIKNLQEIWASLGLNGILPSHGQSLLRRVRCNLILKTVGLNLGLVLRAK